MNTNIKKNKTSGALMVLAAGLMTLAAGCQSNDQTVVLNDADTVPRMPGNTHSTRQLVNLSKDDETAVEMQVYRNLLTGHFWDGSRYTAIFLSADDPEVKALQAEFPDHVPPIKASERVDLPRNGVPRDRDTGKPAIILSVELNEPAADGSVSVTGKSYAGDATTGFYSYILKKNGNNWEFQNSQ